MSQPPPPPFASRFGGPHPPPPPHGFPPPPGLFRGAPQFPTGPFSPFPSGGGGGGLPGPPACPPFPPPPPPPTWQAPPWRPEPPPPERPSGPEPGGDEPWLSRFLAQRRPPAAAAAAAAPAAASGSGSAGEAACAALRLVARLSELCRAWRRLGDGAAATVLPAGEAAEAEAHLEELRRVLRPWRRDAPEGLRRRAERALRKRLRRRRGRQEAREAREEAAARVAQKEAQIERWRARRAQEAEERHREQELKAAADSVLSEVRKKQADTKRMTEILRGLEKLRKLRKEAAARKGVCPPPAADEAFETEVQNLRALIKTRTELYEAEERALRVMLEGEQEEERKREMEKKQKKEKEKLLQQKLEIDSKLFGDPEDFPLTQFLEPFTQYYLQAEYSVPALIQIRHEWDRYLVPADHPEGSCIPPGWILPSPPSNDIWASAVK